jgi:hypothetical protein
MPRSRVYDFERALAKRLPEILQSLGGIQQVRVADRKPATDRPFDLDVRARVAGHDLRLLVEAKSYLNSAVVAEAISHRDLLSTSDRQLYVLAVPRVGEKYQGSLQAHRINYVDLAGNVLLQAPGVFIKVEGKRLPDHLRPLRRKNPFADKASLILRVLLSRRQRAWGVRELAQEAGVSVGWTSETIKALEERYYVSRDRQGNVVLEDPVLALEDWSGFYSYRKNRIVSFLAPSGDAGALLEAASRAIEDAGLAKAHAVTLPAAVNVLLGYVRVNQLHMYVAAESFDSAIRELPSVLDLEEVSGGGNFHLLSPYYRNSVMFGVQEKNGYRLVSDLQLYLDLYHYPVRGREAAELLLQKRIGPFLGLDSSDYRTLVSA